MIALTRVAELDVSAASGLLVSSDALCVIADDELYLAVYDRAGVPLRRVPLLGGALPAEPALRKRAKPDLESLARLPDGRLLALGSGSTAARMRGVVVDPARAWAVREVALDALYVALARQLAELNIEGAVVHGEVLWLAQRGNGARGENALIALDLAQVMGALDAGASRAAFSPRALLAVHPVSLGALQGVPLGLTDLTVHPALGLIWSAAAEASLSTYDDGRCLGSMVGLLSADGRVSRATAVQADFPCKIEGIAVHQDPGESPRLWLVADPDDRSHPAPLFTAEINLS